MLPLFFFQFERMSVRSSDFSFFRLPLELPGGPRPPFCLKIVREEAKWSKFSTLREFVSWADVLTQIWRIFFNVVFALQEKLSRELFLPLKNLFLSIFIPFFIKLNLTFFVVF